MSEAIYREALERIASGLYTERGAENHAKDILRLAGSGCETTSPLTDDEIQRIGSSIRLVAQNPDIEDLQRRGLWLLRLLRSHDLDVIRIGAQKTSGEPT
jgi:hypothetical protein